MESIITTVVLEAFQSADNSLTYPYLFYSRKAGFEFWRVENVYRANV